MNLLKQEINQAGLDLIALAKWKLVIVAGVAIVALGWKDFKPSAEASSFMLYSVGFLCAYVDWFVYKRYIIIHTIAHYIRSYDGTNSETLSLKEYENRMAEYREADIFFYSDRWPHFISSSVISVGLPIFAYFNDPCSFAWRYCVLGVLGLLCVVFLFLKCNINRAALDILPTTSATKDVQSDAN